MALLLLLLFLLSPSFTLVRSAAAREGGGPKLTPDYYSKTCPELLKIVQQVAIDKQLATPTTAAGALRLFFHDCVVGGCDASLLLSSNPPHMAERDHEVNQALPGDAFDVVVRAKTALELQCPGVVSCSDVLALVTKNLVSIVGGPPYQVLLGRRDAIESRASDVEGHIALPNMTLNQIIEVFASRGLNVQEMVTLSGAHTIGFSHCFEFSNRIFNFSKNSQADPTMHPQYVQALQKLCANYTKDNGLAAFNDVITPGKFDNMYYINLHKGLGLLASDQALASDPRTKPYVDLYASNQTAFFEAFARAIEKVSLFNVLTGKEGEVRTRCDKPNQVPMEKKNSN